METDDMEEKSVSGRSRILLVDWPRFPSIAKLRCAAPEQDTIATPMGQPGAIHHEKRGNLSS